MSSVLTALRALAYMTGFVLLWGWLALQARPAGGSMPLSPEAGRGIGGGLMALGGVLVLSCASLFVLLGRGTPAPFDPPRAFVPAGPYRWVRNPMYLGGLLLLAGFAFWHTSVAMALFVVPVIGLVHLFVVLYEEPTLERRFGAEYLGYKARVNRWLPKVPRRAAV